MTTIQPSDYYAPPTADLDHASDPYAGSYPSVFSPRGRLTRLQWLSYLIVLSLVIQVLLSLVMPFVMTFAASMDPVTFTVLLSVGSYVLFAPFNVIWSIKRSHDFNRSGWWSVFALVPVVSLVFVLIPGTPGVNDFGHVRPNRWYHKIALWLMVVSLVAMIAVVGYVVYQDFPASAVGRSFLNQ